MGEKEFQEQFIDFRGNLKSYLFRLTANREDAEDITQETYIKASNSLPSFKGNSSLKTWVFTIATNLAKDNFKARKRWRENTQDRCKETTQASEEKVSVMEKIVKDSEVDKYEIKEHIDYCFTCISKTLFLEQQLTLILKDIYNFKVSEIMEILNLSEGKVKHALADARKNMADIFNKRCSLVSKTGVCYQCSELNGFINPKQNFMENLVKTKMYQEAENNSDKLRLLELRTELIKNVDPLNSSSSELYSYLLGLMPENVE